MGLADIRAAVRATLEGVASIGVVTAYEPLATRREQFESFFKAATLGYMQGWTITREASAETVRNQARTNDRRHVMVIRGYRALADQGASELAFQDLVETACDALRARENDQLGGTADHVGPPTVRIFEPRDFAGYLVHYVEIVYPATEPKTF